MTPVRCILLIAAFVAGVAASGAAAQEPVPQGRTADLLSRLGIDASYEFPRDKEIRRLTPLAQAGDIDAMFALGVGQFGSLSFPWDSSAWWLRQAADRGHKRAMIELGVLTARGYEVPKDDRQAIHWIRRADGRSEAAAMKEIGDGWVRLGEHGVMGGSAQVIIGPGGTRAFWSMGDLNEAKRWYRMAADRGDVPAMRAFAELDWPSEDAKRLLRKAAGKGDLAAMHDLAGVYLWGRGETPNLDEAVRWEKAALRAGDVTAMQGLSEIYEELGGPQHAREVLLWMDRALDRRPDDARFLNRACWLRAISRVELPKALALCDAAIRIAPNSGDFRDSRALVHLQMGEFELARQDYEAALDRQEMRVDSLYGLGIALLRLGQAEKGTDAVEIALGMRPDLAAMFAGYGQRP